MRIAIQVGQHWDTTLYSYTTQYVRNISILAPRYQSVSTDRTTLAHFHQKSTVFIWTTKIPVEFNVLFNRCVTESITGQIMQT